VISTRLTENMARLFQMDNHTLGRTPSSRKVFTLTPSDPIKVRIPGKTPETLTLLTGMSTLLMHPQATLLLRRKMVKTTKNQKLPS
jgi:hypothetical protein